MIENTDDVRRKRSGKPALDRFDRKILGALVNDAGQSYAALGEAVGLSAPAVHERVRRLRQARVIAGTHARLDGEAIGKPFLAFVHVEAAGWGKGERMMRIADFPEVEEMHSVAGDTGLILKVRTQSPHALEALLAQIYAVPGVSSTRSYVVLSTYLERPVQAGITEAWPAF
jgi:Lrp/AsnC family transcriptional regulator, leucine-responsive regulatory protein